jgi:sec-independent protein translocase protein TatB
MFDVAPTEFMLVAVIALLVIGPKELPRVLRMIGQWVGKARGIARQFRSGFDEMMRESELAEMEKKWAEENAKIMAEFPKEEAVQPTTPDKPA